MNSLGPQVLAKILGTPCSTAEKAAFLQKFGHHFKFAQMPEHAGSKEWEEFREAEVLDSLLETVSTLDLNDFAAIALLEAVLTRLRDLFFNSATSTIMCTDPQMKLALRDQMPQVIATIYNALETVPNPEEPLCMSIWRSALIIIGAILMSPVFKDDQTFLHSLNRDSVLSILFKAYITSEPTSDAIPLFHGTTILSSFKDGNFDNKAIETVLQRHTTEDAARRCLELFENDDLCTDSTLLGAMLFMVFANNSPEMGRSLGEVGVHKPMLQRYWKWFPSKKRGEEEMCLLARDMVTAIKSLLRSLEEGGHNDLKTRVTSEMVRDEDLMMILGRALLGRSSFESAKGDVLYIGGCIAEAESSNKEFMNGDMKTAYMHCFKCLDDFMYSAPHKRDEHKGKSPSYEPDPDQPDFTPAIQGWKEFGKLLGFDRNKIREEEANRRKTEMHGLEGCSWFRCCLYRDTKVAPLREMMRCSACKSVQYCGRRCQKLDWKEGGHQLECSKKVTAAR